MSLSRIPRMVRAYSVVVAIGAVEKKDEQYPVRRPLGTGSNEEQQTTMTNVGGSEIRAAKERKKKGRKQRRNSVSNVHRHLGLHLPIPT